MDTGVATVGDGIRMHYLRAGEGPLIVLLHGWPQTSDCWRKVIPDLARTHTVIAPDLRGYGLTDKPTTGYDKRRMAADISELIHGLGFDSAAAVVGHDRGARVAHRWALDRPDQIERLVILDVLPTREMFARMDGALAASHWHWFFHIQPDLPERLVGRDVRGYLEYFFERWTYDRHGLEPAAVDAYVRAFERPGAVRAGFDDYRAQETDLALDDADYAAGKRVQMPLLALWGSTGLPAKLPALEIWQAYAKDVRGTQVDACGHFIAEERPHALLEHLRGFVSG
ncbi:alpha/beta fold hydrolase [Streptomyces boninensis]|uniref:alpha/beta fold hydrolase n=1 Tax=Streptomyces boninensis TaxID=2039455 RepID=UPI003B20D6D5